MQKSKINSSQFICDINIAYRTAIKSHSTQPPDISLLIKDFVKKVEEQINKKP